MGATGDAERTERLKTALERNMKAIKLRPSIGRGTAVTKVRIRDGCTADVEDGGWKLVADAPKNDGGNGEGPDSGVFGRAALGTCLAIGYAEWAAVLGVPLDSIEVEVHADYDASGMFGIDTSKKPGWRAVRYIVRVESTAPESDVQKLIDHADSLSPLLDDFARPLPITRELHITGPVP
jgi:uncharacterized OsmC-like protein